jgi:hypothetical protein
MKLARPCVFGSTLVVFNAVRIQCSDVSVQYALFHVQFKDVRLCRTRQVEGQYGSTCNTNSASATHIALQWVLFCDIVFGS